MTGIDEPPAPESDMIAVLLAGATTPILEHLRGLGDGATVLDLACGTGEPAATILHEHPSWHLIGVDTAEDALVAARERAPTSSATFRVGSMDDVGLPDAHVDAVVSRMGALMMGDAAATAREIIRVLRPGGRISVAAWAEMEHNPFLAIALDTLRSARLPTERLAGMAPWFADMAAPGVREGWLRAAGATTADSYRFSWSATFPDFDTWWRYETGGVPDRPGGPLTAVLAELDQPGRDRVRGAMLERTADYRAPDGTYAIPATAQLVHGVR